ncbi:MAG: hypothetical protein IAE91_08705, partial [Ignavibacteriaceae bacterium]|nr:hypothetical protein [Ignavibacteriaceae bacterium]
KLPLLLFSILYSLNGVIFSQTPQTGVLTTRINSFIDNMPDSSLAQRNAYTLPEWSDLQVYRRAIEQLVLSNISTAAQIADSINFQIVIFTDTTGGGSRIYHILEKQDTSSKHWGVFILNTIADRQSLFIQAPHPKFDFNTGKQGIHVFTRIGARAFYVSGTQRCNNDTSSSCAGTTTVCTGASTPFRISDQPHTVQGPLQFATQAMDSLITDLIVIQLHGFTKLESDPYVIMSNGNRTEPPSTNRLLALKNNLLTEDPDLTFKIAHIDLDYDKLLGTTNTQGRLINGSTNPCNSSASNNPDRFLHLEQERYKLRNDSTGWNKMTNALAATFPLDPLPVELVSFYIWVRGSDVELHWNTATEIDSRVFEIELLSLNQNSSWIKIGEVPAAGFSNSPKYYNFKANLKTPGNYLFRLKIIDFDGSFEYSPELFASVIAPLKYELKNHYPNPVNLTENGSSLVNFNFVLAGEGSVVLELFNSAGEKIDTVKDQVMPAGEHSVAYNIPSNLVSGIYFYKLKIKNSSGNTVYIKSSKLALIR